MDDTARHVPTIPPTLTAGTSTSDRTSGGMSDISPILVSAILWSGRVGFRSGFGRRSSMRLSSTSDLEIEKRKEANIKSRGVMSL